jgi:hypothetical protein
VAKLEPPAQGEEINQFRSGQQALEQTQQNSYLKINAQHENMISIYNGSRK